MLKILKRKDYKRLTDEIVDLRLKLEETKKEKMTLELHLKAAENKNNELKEKNEQLEDRLKKTRQRQQNESIQAKRKWLNAEFGETYEDKK